MGKPGCAASNSSSETLSGASKQRISKHRFGPDDEIGLFLHGHAGQDLVAALDLPASRAGRA